MYFSDFVALLRARLSESANKTQAEVARDLCNELHVDDLEFQNETGNRIPAQTLFRKTLQIATFVSVRVPLQVQDSVAVASVPTQSEASMSVPTTSTSGAGGSGVDFSADFFIKEFDRLERIRLERNRGLMWAGFVVKEMLPGLGFGTIESKQVLKQLEAKGIVVIEKHPNPKNPEHPTTCVRLNRENTRVRAVLQGGNGTESSRRIKIQGEPISETIIRERR